MPDTNSMSKNVKSDHTQFLYHPSNAKGINFGKSDGVEFLSVKELAIRLRVSQSTVYNWVEMELIPHYKVRKKVMFRWVEVEHWLKGFHHPGRNARHPYRSPLPNILKGVL